MKGMKSMRKDEPTGPTPEACDHKFVDSVGCLKCGWEPLPRRFVILWRGHAVKFDPVQVRRTYSLVNKYEATHFTSASSAMQTARGYGLRQEDVQIKPFQPIE